MRTITVEIDCGETTCDKCWFVWGSSIKPFCKRFNRLLAVTDGETYLRLPECLNAEAKQ